MNNYVVKTDLRTRQTRVTPHVEDVLVMLLQSGAQKIIIGKRSFQKIQEMAYLERGRYPTRELHYRGTQ